jgi:hypothetical protein
MQYNKAITIEMKNVSSLIPTTQEPNKSPPQHQSVSIDAKYLEELIGSNPNLISVLTNEINKSSDRNALHSHSLINFTQNATVSSYSGI